MHFPVKEAVNRGRHIGLRLIPSAANEALRSFAMARAIVVLPQPAGP
jgi:hypothetical protein